MISTTSYGYTFAPGTVGEAHLTVLTGQHWNATVTIE